MNKGITFWFLISAVILAAGCARLQSDNAVVRVNDFAITCQEFREALQDSSYAAVQGGEKEFLEDLINRRLLLQQAELLGLEQEQGFLKEVERFWEKTLLKRIIDRKSKELAGGVRVNEDEIRACYDEMVRQGSSDASYDKMYDQIKWQLLRERQTAAFNDWLQDLRKQARIEINKELLEVE